MSNKRFAERLNKALDDMEVPERQTERIESFAKLIRVPRFKAEAILNGMMPLDADLLSVLTQELEVSEEWLLGK